MDYFCICHHLMLMQNLFLSLGTACPDSASHSRHDNQSQPPLFLHSITKVVVGNCVQCLMGKTIALLQDLYNRVTKPSLNGICYHSACLERWWLVLAGCQYMSIQDEQDSPSLHKNKIVLSNQQTIGQWHPDYASVENSPSCVCKRVCNLVIWTTVIYISNISSW